jgi:hypothetical protein
MSIGVGLTNSVVFLARNTNENNNAIGVTTSAVYALSKFFRLSADYTRYGKINIIPTWYNIRANTVETNLQIIFRSKNSLYFYPQFGLSYNTFSGYFTGKEDYLNLSAIYPQNQNVTSKWLGFNSGVGLEYKISSIMAFASAKMRVGFTKGHSDLNILDVCYTFGLRYNFQVPSISKIFHGGNRYNLDLRKKV